MLCVLNLSLIFLNIFYGIYSTPKESKYTTVFLSINNETQCVPLLFLPLKFMTYTLSFVLGKLFLEKTPINTGIFEMIKKSLKYFIISILQQNKKILSTYSLPALLTPLPVIPFTTEEITGCTNEVTKGVNKAGRNPPSCFLISYFTVSVIPSTNIF